MALQIFLSQVILSSFPTLLRTPYTSFLHPFTQACQVSGLLSSPISLALIPYEDKIFQAKPSFLMYPRNFSCLFLTVYKSLFLVSVTKSKNNFSWLLVNESPILYNRITGRFSDFQINFFINLSLSICSCFHLQSLLIISNFYFGRKTLKRWKN